MSRTVTRYRKASIGREASKGVDKEAAPLVLQKPRIRSYHWQRTYPWTTAWADPWSTAAGRHRPPSFAQLLRESCGFRRSRFGSQRVGTGPPGPSGQTEPTAGDQVVSSGHPTAGQAMAPPRQGVNGDALSLCLHPIALPSERPPVVSSQRRPPSRRR